MRLLPRFSLRFAMLALTVFLIVFSVGVKYWRRDLEHAASLARLQASDYAIEEEEDSLFFGQHTAKRIVGLIAPDHLIMRRLVYSSHSRPVKVEPVDPDSVTPFLELPRPGDLRGLAIGSYRYESADWNRIFTKLAQCTNLERLHLSNGLLTEAHLETLGTLTELRILDLDQTQLENEDLQFLRQLSKLEMLRISGSENIFSPIGQYDLPNLKVLIVEAYNAIEVPLTRASLGKLPALEVLIFKNCTINRLACEPDCLPRLKHLAILQNPHMGKIHWRDVLSTAPQLESLAFHAGQIDAELLDGLRLPQIRRACVSHDGDFRWDATTNYAWTYYQEMVIPMPPDMEKPFLAYLAQRPDLQFFKSIEQMEELILPAKYWLDEGLYDDDKRHWPSEHWIKRTLRRRAFLGN